MLETSGRLLRLLSLLQARSYWPGEELADRLGVTTRTVRRDVDRLRNLGYPVDAASGRQGGYRLGVGAALPPLLLDDDEAVAVAIGLRAATNGAVVGVESTAMAALAKLDQVLPTRLRHRVDALVSSTVAFPTGPRADAAPELLMLLAQACRGQERVRFGYRDREGAEGERMVEPFRLVSTARQWYLVARDVRQDAWRTYRVDRITGAEATGHRFVRESPPDAVAQVAEGMAVAPYAIQARVRLHATLSDAERMMPRSVGRLAEDGGSTMLTIGGNDVAWLVMVLLSLRCDFEVLEPAELRTAVRERAHALSSANA